MIPIQHSFCFELNTVKISDIKRTLIELAQKAGKSDSDNKKRGNPQKVDEFRQAELEQYIEEALFMLELIGIKVFKKDKKKSTINNPSLNKTKSQKVENVIRPSSPKPPLPEGKLKVGRFVKTAMENLANSGYTFSQEMLQALCSETSMHTVVGMSRNLPFFKLYDPNEKYGYLINGRPRFYSSPLSFGTVQVYLNSQIYESDREAFIKWYASL